MFIEERFNKLIDLFIKYSYSDDDETNEFLEAAKQLKYPEKPKMEFYEKDDKEHYGFVQKIEKPKQSKFEVGEKVIVYDYYRLSKFYEKGRIIEMHN